MTKKQRAAIAVELMKSEYPDAICSLNYQDAFQLLIATRLSAQCTDARVNIVTPALFKRFPRLILGKLIGQRSQSAADFQIAGAPAA